jgi:glucosamine--fructose-6-phosphate aminotransferase (isomerizing)
MKYSTSSKSFDEITSQPDVWRDILDGWEKQYKTAASLLKEMKHGRIVFTGCGTTYALGLCAVESFRRYQLDAHAYPASEIAFYPELTLDQAEWLVAVSRSGMTSETLWAVHAFRERSPRGKVCVISTRTDSELARLADLVLDASPAQEQSIVETRSFTAMLLQTQLLAASIKEDHGFPDRVRTLPDILKTCLQGFSEMAKKIIISSPVDRFFFLGSGPLYGIACEAAFKIKEFTCGWGEAFSTLEFRHGPMSAVNGESLVVGLFSDRQMESEYKLLKEMKDRGGQVLAILEDKCPDDWNGLDYVFELSSGLNEFERVVLYLPLIQMIAYQRALAAGLDPDHPKHLKAVTQL